MRRRLALLALVALALPACGKDVAPGAWVRQAAALSAQADAAQAAGQPAQARATLEQLLALPAPAGVAPADRRAVRQDARARLAQALLAEGQPQAALAQAQEGLREGEAQDLFTANLHAVRGRALEAAGRDAEAVADYSRALAIEEALLDRALREHDGGGR